VILLGRKRFPHGEFYEHLAAQYYGFTLLYFGYIIGTMTVATGVVLAFIVSIVGQGIISYITTQGELPYAPLVLNLQMNNGSPCRRFGSYRRGKGIKRECSEN
jgi:hypothetical protein